MRPSSIRSLDLRTCGDEEIMQKISSHPNVTSVNLSFNKQVTDVAIQAIKNACPHLKYLDVRGCTQLQTVGCLAIYGDL